MTAFPRVTSSDIDEFEDRLKAAMQTSSRHDIRTALIDALRFIENSTEYCGGKHNHTHLNNATSIASHASLELTRRLDAAEQKIKELTEKIDKETK